MKKSVLLITAQTFIFILIISLISTISYAQKTCMEKTGVYDCATEVDKMIYLKDFTVKLKPQKRRKNIPGNKWEVTLTEGILYSFNLCLHPSSPKSVVMRLYGIDQEENECPLIEIYNHIPVDFICVESKMYYITIRYVKDLTPTETCAIGILGFVGTN